MKLIICGYARHGKDQAAEILKDEFGLTHESSSHFCLRKFVRTKLALDGITYPSEEACYEDRVNHRARWFKYIAEHNAGDPSRLTREIFDEYDIYVGIRNVVELKDAIEKDVTDLVIWIDATERVGTIESTDSNTITAADCDVIVPNNGTIADLRRRLVRLFTGRLIPSSAVNMAGLEGSDMMPLKVIDANGETVGVATLFN